MGSGIDINRIFSLLSGKAANDDTLLIALFIFILYRNGADMKLLLALGYILL